MFKRAERLGKICQSCHLADGNSFVPLDHLLWLQNHLLIHELSRTLHKGLNKNNNTHQKQVCQQLCVKKQSIISELW